MATLFPRGRSGPRATALFAAIDSQFRGRISLLSLTTQPEASKTTPPQVRGGWWSNIETVDDAIGPHIRGEGGQYLENELFGGLLVSCNPWHHASHIKDEPDFLAVFTYQNNEQCHFIVEDEPIHAIINGMYRGWIITLMTRARWLGRVSAFQIRNAVGKGKTP